MKKLGIGDRVMVEGTIAALDGDGFQIMVRDGELPPVGTFYFSNLAGIREQPPTCAECGSDMSRNTISGVYYCDNDGGSSSRS